MHNEDELIWYLSLIYSISGFPQGVQMMGVPNYGPAGAPPYAEAPPPYTEVGQLLITQKFLAPGFSLFVRSAVAQ